MPGSEIVQQRQNHEKPDSKNSQPAECVLPLCNLKHELAHKQKTKEFSRIFGAGSGRLSEGCAARNARQVGRFQRRLFPPESQKLHVVEFGRRAPRPGTPKISDYAPLRFH